MRPLSTLALLLPLSVGFACRPEGKGKDDGEATGAAALSLYPPVGGQGTSMEIAFSSTRAAFDFQGTTLDLGPGIRIDAVNVDDGFGARAAITIEPDAELGARTAVVESAGRSYTLTDSFEVIAESFSVTPSTVRIGETVDVDLLGQNTLWEGGVTWPSFGDGVRVEEFTVLSETLATATLAVESDAAPGWRNVVMDNGGGNLVTLYEGMKVDRVALAARFEPTIAEQGDTVEFTVFARGTDFLAGAPEITFFDRFGENPDIVIDSVTVLDAENLYGQMTLSNAAALGNRDVRLQTGDEGVLIGDAFEVVGGDWSLSEVAIDLSFTVVRVKDDTTGEISEFVEAQCIFFIPLDPPCPQGGGGGSGSESGAHPSPYDSNGVWMATGEGSGAPEDCPFPTTVSAGDYVWLESDDNIITLEKQIDTGSGMIFYTAQGLTLADYVTNNVYDLHTQGDPDGIPEYILDAVQPTVPSDWQWVAPDFSGGFVHNRADDLVYEWTPAMTYPDAIFVTSIFTQQSPGPMAMENWAGYVGAIPWDDGVHTFTGGELSQLAPGRVPFFAYSFIEGPAFGLPESIYQENTAVSYIYLAQSLVLE